MASGDEGDSDGLLAGFLFGNIDERGELEDDFIDDEAKRSLSQLANFGIVQSFVKDIGNDSISNNEANEPVDYNQKSFDSIDYSNIDELAEENVEQRYSTNVFMKQETDSDDYDADDDGQRPGPSQSHKPAIHLPSIVPKAETMSMSEQSEVAHLFSPSSPPEAGMLPGDTKEESTNDQSVPTTQEETFNAEMEIDDVEEEKPTLTGLAALEGKTVTDIFPDFRPGKVLRFSRLFGPKKYVSAQWKGIKKKKRKRKLLPIDNVLKQTGFELRYGPPPKPEDLAPNEAILHVQPIPLWAYGDQYKYLKATPELNAEATNGEEIDPEWLYGPASYWYLKNDHLIENGKFNYGFKQKTEEDKKIEEKQKNALKGLPPDNHFNLVCLKKWEDDIIWSSEDYKPKENSAALRSLAGWIPSGNIRTMQAYLAQFANKDRTSADSLISANILKNFDKAVPALNKDPNSHKVSDWYSLFPIENHELIYGKWEDKIIWDSESVAKMPTPEVFKLDPNDEKLILNLPDDVATKQPEQEEKTPKKEYKSKSRFMKKDSQQDSEEDAVVGKPQKDRYNLSNDEFYMPKQDLAENQLQADLSSLNIQHSTPAVELQRPFFPTYFTPLELRNLHRPALNKKKLSSKTKGYQVVHSLYKRIKKKSKEREKERQSFGGGEMFFMRQPEDLSGMDGDMVFMEHCEEIPPLVCQAGMNTRIRNYYRRKHGKDSSAPTMDYGDISYVQHSPFLGQLSPGQTLQALENNLFRAPIFQHRVPSYDFLTFKTSHGYYARKVKDIFTVGQLCPKYEVHGPNSKRANNHIRDFLQVFIYRLFLKCPDTPKRIKMEDIRKAFPKHSESTVRKRLKLCADFRRTGADCNWWVLKSDFRLPSEEEMRAMVTPEQTSAYYMMMAAEQRLKDAGYGEKSLFAPDDDDNEDDAKKVDEEIQTAPWNTTRAYIQAMKGKCLLQVTGVADPTGCGEGFSYIRIPNKPITKDETEEQKQAKKQKLVTGTDADLRRLNLKQARLLLKEFGVSQEEIEKLSRWEVIDKVRTMSTAAAKQGTTEVAMNKFARGSRFTVAEHQEKYKDECQRIFDLQNRVLGSDAILSTDEESSGEEGSDIEDLGKDLESMLSNKKISSEEHEEAERRELQKLLSQDRVEKDSTSNGSRPSSATPSRQNLLDKSRTEEDGSSLLGFEAGKRLLIHRKFKEGDREFTRTETVKNPHVIEAYLRIVTRDKNYREVFASQDEKHKEDMRRERRRIQEQLRRIRRNEERERIRQLQQSIEQGQTSVQPTAEDQAKIDALSDKPTKILKCGACGDYGHMKTNKMCPKYSEASYNSMTDDDFNLEEMSNISQDNLIKVEGTKITLGKALLEAHEDMKRKSLTIRIPKENVIPVMPEPPPPKKKRRPPSSTQTNADYLVRHHKSKNRRRTNPVVALNVVLEYVSGKLKDVPDSWPFHNPVSAKVVPDYYDIVKNPMDLQTIRENIKKGVYHTRDDFLEHVTLIHTNCLLYNGVQHPLTKLAESLVHIANEEIRTKEKELGEIEREINPLLDEDPQVGFSWLCESILAAMKAMPESWPFHQPVPVKVVPDYYDVIKSPIDLETLKQRCQGNMYQNREQFLSDVNLLYSNSLAYNGAEHAFTKTAERMTKRCMELVEQNAEKFSQLEIDVFNLPDYEEASTNPPSVATSDINEEDPGFAYETDPFNLNSLQPTDKQLVTAGNEDEFVDIEGDENMLQQYKQQQQQRQGFEELGFGEHESAGYMEGMENYQQHIYTGDFEHQEGFEDFQPDMYSSNFGTEMEGHEGQGGSRDNVDIVDLLLQDLVHSDEDEEDSEEDIPLDDGDDDIPLDDGEEEDFEMEDESQDATQENDDEEEEGGAEEAVENVDDDENNENDGDERSGDESDQFVDVDNADGW